MFLKLGILFTLWLWFSPAGESGYYFCHFVFFLQGFFKLKFRLWKNAEKSYHSFLNKVLLSVSKEGYVYSIGCTNVLFKFLQDLIRREGKIEELLIKTN